MVLNLPWKCDHEWRDLPEDSPWSKRCDLCGLQLPLDVTGIEPPPGGWKYLRIHKDDPPPKVS